MDPVRLTPPLGIKKPRERMRVPDFYHNGIPFFTYGIRSLIPHVSDAILTKLADFARRHDCRAIELASGTPYGVRAEFYGDNAPEYFASGRFWINIDSDGRLMSDSVSYSKKNFSRLPGYREPAEIALLTEFFPR